MLDRAEEAWGEIDVVMNIAGVIRPGEIRSIQAEDVDYHFDINVKGLIFGTRAAAQRMIPRGRGHIINVASLASMAPIPGLGLYSASKYAVRGFSLSAAEELRHHGIAVTTVCPDAVDTPMVDKQLDYPRSRHHLHRTTPAHGGRHHPLDTRQSAPTPAPDRRDPLVSSAPGPLRGSLSRYPATLRLGTQASRASEASSPQEEFLKSNSLRWARLGVCPAKSSDGVRFPIRSLRSHEFPLQEVEAMRARPLRSALCGTHSEPRPPHSSGSSSSFRPFRR